MKNQKWTCLILFATLAISLPAFAGDGSTFSAAMERGIIWAHLFVFTGGILASFTPCVYPMIPITVSIFGARAAKTKLEAALLSATYVLGIAFMYSTLGVVAALTGGLFGSAMQNPWIIFGIALFFVAMGLSMMGLFEIQLPPSLQTKFSMMGGRGFVGAFIMGLVAGIIAAPCTGPVLGGVLVFVAATKNALLGFSLLFTFAIGMGLLFFVIGTFAVSLPKSGDWMEIIKVIFAAILFTVAVFFIKPHIQLLRDFGSSSSLRLITSSIIILAGFIITAFVTKAHTDKMKKTIKVVGALIATAGGILFVGYISPPTESGTESASEGINWIKNEKEGLEAAKAQNKPVMIDFYADWCTACKELDKLTYTDPKVIEEAKQFVCVKIDFTDDTEENEALGDKYNAKSLPTVVFLSPEGKEIEDTRPPNGFIKPEEFLIYMQKAK